MMRKKTASLPRAERLRSRLTTQIMLTVMLGFLAIGIIAALLTGIFNRQGLQDAQAEVIDQIIENSQEWWLRAQEEVRFLVNASTTRAFANISLDSTASPEGRDALYAEMLQTLVSSLERQRSILAVRYITANGYVVAEVTRYDGGEVQVSTQPRLFDQMDQRLFQLGLGAPANTIITSDLTFRMYPNRDQLVEPLTPLMRFVAPVDSTGESMSRAGQIQIDVSPEPIFSLLRELAQTNAEFIELRRRILVLDGANNLLLDTNILNANLLRRLANNFGVSLESQLPEVVPSISGELPRNPFPVGDRLYTARALPIGGTGSAPWRVLLADDLNSSLTTSGVFALAMLALVIVIGGGISLLASRIVGRALQPLEETAAVARRVSADDMGGDTLTMSTMSGMDEITQAFTQLRRQVGALNQSLDASTRRYQRNLEIASRISQETARLSDIDTLFQRTIDLICDEFGFYHAQIFLVDDVSEYAVLRYSHGEAGQALLDRGHKLGVGSRSVIGRVTQASEPVVVNDTHSESTVHRPNPLLPDTRAEIALPMRINEQVIGALDIQSTLPDVFRDEEVQIFQLLADQLAVALQNARLAEQAQQRLRQVDNINRQFTQQAWQELLARGEVDQAYHYNLLGVEPGADVGGEHRIPITVRGVPVGELTATAGDANMLTEGDEAFLRAIADRVGLAIENARLLGEIQTSLSETFVLYQLSRTLSEAYSLSDVIGAIISSVMPDAEAGIITLFDEESGNEHLTISAEWHPTRKLYLEGERLVLAEHPLLESMRQDQVTLVEDIDLDRRVDERLRALLRDQMGIRAAVIVPFSVRTTWRGVMVIGYAHARSFAEREGRLFHALIDQAGVTVDNRILLNENELALAQIERLYSGSRVVNMAQSAQDVVRAAVATNNDMSIGFELALLEGDLDATGYPGQMRIVARSVGNETMTSDQTYPLAVAADSRLRQREPLFISMDSRQPGASDFARYMRSNRYEFGLVFPLYSANQPIALFFVVSEENRVISQDDMEIFRALTGQMSTVLQNRRLLEQTAQALDETRRLYEASRAIAVADSAVAIYAAAVEPLASAIPTLSRASVWLASGDGSYDAPFVANAYDWSRVTQTQTPAGRLSADVVPFGRLFNAYRSALLYNRPKDELPPLGLQGLLGLLEKNNSQSVLIVPLQTRQKWLGVLLIESEQSDAFASQFIPFTQAVADQLALAIDSLQSFNEAQLQARRALALSEAGQLANRIGADLSASFQEVLRRVAEAADYRAWQLVVLDETREWLEEVTAYLPHTEQTHEQRYGVHTARHSIVDAYRTNAPVIVNDPASYPAFAALAPDAQRALGKHLAVPIHLQRELLGVLYMGRYAHEENISERDEQLLLTLASQIAVALENRRLLRSAEVERETLQNILDSLPVGVIVLDGRSLRPVSYNHQAEVLLGKAIDPRQMFTVEYFNLYRTGTDMLYPVGELPLYTALNSQRPEFSDDVTVVHSDGKEIDLLVNAAPLFDGKGSLQSVIVAFQNISTLRSLENTLQDNLRETITLYETTRALAEAASIEDVLDLALFQLSLQEANQVYILLQREGALEVARTLDGQPQEFPLPSHLLDPFAPQFYQSVARSQLAPEDRQALSALGIEALVTLPLRSRARDNTVLGWVVLTYASEQDISLEREQAITTLVESAAVTLDNRYLIMSTEAALAETASLYAATSAVSRARGREDLVSAIEGAILWLEADSYATYIMRDTLMPVFNNSMDGAPVDYLPLLHALPNPEQLLLIPDTRLLPKGDPLHAPLAAIGVIQAVAVAPLRAQGSINGYVVVAYHTPRKFDENFERYLSSLTDSASVVADNIFLLDQVQSSLNETSALYLASRDLNDAVTETDLLNVFIEHLLDNTTSRVMVMTLSDHQWQDAGAYMTVTATWQPEGSNLPDLLGTVFSREDFPAWEILNTDDVIFSDDIMTDPRLDELQRQSLSSLGILSFSVLPLRSGTRLMGVMLLSSDTPTSHSESNLRVYRSFSRQASLRLEASRLFAQTQRRERQLVTSARVSQLASTLEELPRLLPMIVEMIKDAFAYDHAQIFLMDDEKRFAVLRASTGEAGEKLLAINHRLEKGSQSVIGRVTATGEPVIALDTANSRVPHKPNPLLPRTRSEMAVPLILKGEVIGALDVQSNQPNFFNDDDVTVLTTLASQISVAIDNAQLYDQSQARAKDMYFLFTVASSASGAENLMEAANNIVLSLQELLSAASVSIYLPVALSDGETTITELRPMAVAGTTMPISEISQVRLDDPDSLLAEAAAARRPIVLEALDDEPRYLPIIEDAQSVMLVPLTLGNDLIALVTVESARRAAFDDDSLTLLLTLSGSLAATVQNQLLLEDLQRSNEQLVELDRLKSDFLANMSHELRTPLNSIIGFSRVILKGIDGPLTEMQEQDLTTIFNSGQHLLNLINDILDQAKIAAGKMDIQTEYFDIKPVIDGVRSIGIGLVKDKPIEISVHLDSGLPKAYGDEFRLRQVLLNLVSNAAKFTNQGSITIHAHLIQQESDVPMISIDVTDTGMGIAEKDLPLLFEAFRQVDSSLTKTHGGTGLGLPIAKSLMEMQGGTITVKSTVNVGSTFSILIPTAPAPVRTKTEEMPEVTPPQHSTSETGALNPDALPPHVLAALAGGEAPAVPEADSSARNGGSTSQDTAKQFIPVRRRAPVHVKRQILLVEDNLDLVDQLRRTLQRDGFEVFTVSTAMEAEAMASGLRPTLIVIDADFANRSGWALLERFLQRDDTADTPIIVLALGDEAEQARALGAFHFIRKPFMPETLSEATRQAEQAARIDRILIIDDDHESARLLQDLLGEAGSYRVYHADNGVEGVSMVARRRPDLVICDLRMPEMDGFKVIEELRSNPETADIPIMIVTGDTLNQGEINQLSEMKVIYKPDIDVAGYRTFLENVRTQLSRQNGDT